VRGLSIAVIMLALALGCTSAMPAPPTQPQPPAVQPAQPKQVKLGMTASEVEALMGKPDLVQPVEAAPGMEVWVYDVGRVMLSDGKVVLTDPDPLPVH